MSVLPIRLTHPLIDWSLSACDHIFRWRGPSRIARPPDSVTMMCFGTARCEKRASSASSISAEIQFIRRFISLRLAGACGLEVVTD